jgi:UDP-N-acetylmuramate dehydrogenase
MNIEYDKSLQHYNTFGIDVSAKYFTEIKSLEDYALLITDPMLKDEKKLILGGGSNLLFRKKKLTCWN